MFIGTLLCGHQQYAALGEEDWEWGNAKTEFAHKPRSEWPTTSVTDANRERAGELIPGNRLDLTPSVFEPI